MEYEKSDTVLIHRVSDLYRTSTIDHIDRYYRNVYSIPGQLSRNDCMQVVII